MAKARFRLPIRLQGVPFLDEELPPSDGSVPVAQPAEPPEAEPITVTGGPSFDPVGAPQVVQPAWANATPPPGFGAIDPNSASLLDRRKMIYDAKQAQMQAAAQASGGDYEIREQSADPTDFKAKPGLQFGTHGVLRDVIGNGVDFLGSLVGRKPTYRKEKFMDRIYGWDQPGQFEAAMNRGMEYDPELTQEFMKNITGIRNAEESTAANKEYRGTMAQSRTLDALGGLATSVVAAPNPEAEYARARPALQAMANKAYGVGEDGEPVYRLPETYERGALDGLTRAGYDGGNTQRELTGREADQTKRWVVSQKLLKQDEWERLKASTRVTVATIAANASMSNAQKAAAVREAIAADRGEDPILTGVDPITGNRTYAPKSSVTSPSRFRRIQ